MKRRHFILSSVVTAIATTFGWKPKVVAEEPEQPRPRKGDIWKYPETGDLIVVDKVRLKLVFYHFKKQPDIKRAMAPWQFRDTYVFVKRKGSEDNPKGLPVVLFDEKGKIINGEELFKDINWTVKPPFFHSATRRRRAWVPQLTPMAQTRCAGACVFWGEVMMENYSWGQIDVDPTEHSVVAYRYASQEGVTNHVTIN